MLNDLIRTACPFLPEKTMLFEAKVDAVPIRQDGADIRNGQRIRLSQKAGAEYVQEAVVPKLQRFIVVRARMMQARRCFPREPRAAAPVNESGDLIVARKRLCG